MLRRLLMITALLAFTIPAGRAIAADTTNVTVNASIIDGGFCLIFTPNVALNFGNLDPANPVNVNASTTINIWCFRLFGATVTYLATDDDGLHETGNNQNRMQHTVIPTEYLPYTMSITPFSATIPRFTVTALTINGTVQGSAYQGSTVAPGNYQDTVIVNIIP